MVIALVLTGCVWVIVSQLDRFRHAELSHHLTAQAAALEIAVRDQFSRARATELDALAQQVGAAALEGVRVTFVLADGTVLGDSEGVASEMESHADRPEIRQALASGIGESVRWSHTVSKNMKYVAVRVGSEEKPLGVVRVSMALQSIAARAQPARRLAATIALVSVLAAVLLAGAVAFRWSRRIQRVTEAARSISLGDLSARVDVVGHDEVAALGRSLNKMRERLSTDLNTIDRQRRTLDALLSQLREGVVVVDADARIVLINSEAIAMLHPAPPLPGDFYVGRSVEQCVPHRTLQDLLRHCDGPAASEDVEPALPHDGQADCRIQEKPHEIELRLSTTAGVRSVLARAFDVRLPGTNANEVSPGTAAQIGRALVLTDITELARVMQVKADLAANASHELRTPLSAIRAAVDTLLSMNAQGESADASQFIDVIDRHSRRMEALIGDLLELSRLESGTAHFDAVAISGKALLQELRIMFADAVVAKNLQWKASVSSDDVRLHASPELLRMILRNLLDNAIRFTDPGGDVTLSVRRDRDTVAFEVADTGCGIPPDEQQRVFERFYQVEPARSGPHRGTGLGLSIVRHAAAAINARIELRSALGDGTKITFWVPVPQGA